MKNKTLLWITSLLCLLPLVYSAVVYPTLPEQIAIHWNSAGEADNFVPKAIAAFGLPFLFVAINLYSKIRLLNDPKAEGQSQAIKQLSIWLIPVLALVLVPFTLLTAMGVEIPLLMMASLLLGLLLVVIGNYLPKSRQNYTIGVKLPWTLNDPDNWNKTNRLAGYLSMAGGALLIVWTFLKPETAFQIPVTILIVLALILLPLLYSFSLYKTEERKNENTH